MAFQRMEVCHKVDRVSYVVTRNSASGNTLLNCQPPAQPPPNVAAASKVANLAAAANAAAVMAKIPQQCSNAAAVVNQQQQQSLIGLPDGKPSPLISGGKNMMNMGGYCFPKDCSRSIAGSKNDPCKKPKNEFLKTFMQNLFFGTKNQLNTKLVQKNGKITIYFYKLELLSRKKLF
jgi:hypothetical protein